MSAAAVAAFYTALLSVYTAWDPSNPTLSATQFTQILLWSGGYTPGSKQQKRQILTQLGGGGGGNLTATELRSADSLALHIQGVAGQLQLTRSAV